MIMYKFVVGVYIDEKDTEKLKELCDFSGFEFEDDTRKCHNDPEWQEHYRNETGFSGIVKRCYVTNKTNDRTGVEYLFDMLENSDIDMMINIELS